MNENIIICIISILLSISIMWNIILYINLKNYNIWLDKYLKDYVTRKEYIDLNRKYYTLKNNYKKLQKKYIKRKEK